MSQYDLLVIGAGPGGYVAAIKAAQLGMSVAIIEKDQLGGTCLNRGCIPTKTLLHASKMYTDVQDWAELGLSCMDADFDLSKMYQRKDAVVNQLRDGIAALLNGNNIEIIDGEAKIIGANTVRVDDVEYQAKNILIAAGSCPHSLPIPGCDLSGVINSDDVLAYPENYRSLVIIGGGVVGMEFATLYQQLGCRVTVIEALERILPGTDREISQNLAMIMKKQGVQIYTKASVKEIVSQDNNLVCCFSANGQEEEIVSKGVLVSVGRKGAARELFASQLEMDCSNGQIKVDQFYRTRIANIYAVGDIVEGSWQLAHTASAAGINAVCHMAGEPPAMDMQTVPGCIFTDPEIAVVGMTADEAKKAGIEVNTGKYLMSGNGKSIIETDKRSFIKLVCDAKSQAVIGAQLMCAHASDLVNELSLAISKGLRAHDIASVIHPHPTLSEGIAEAAEDVSGCSIHTMPRRR